MSARWALTGAPFPCVRVGNFFGKGKKRSSEDAVHTKEEEVVIFMAAVNRALEG